MHKQRGEMKQKSHGDEYGIVRGCTPHSWVLAGSHCGYSIEIIINRFFFKATSLLWRRKGWGRSPLWVTEYSREGTLITWGRKGLLTAVSVTTSPPQGLRRAPQTGASQTKKVRAWLKKRPFVFIWNRHTWAGAQGPRNQKGGRKPSGPETGRMPKGKRARQSNQEVERVLWGEGAGWAERTRMCLRFKQEKKENWGKNVLSCF